MKKFLFIILLPMAVACSAPKQSVGKDAGHRITDSSSADAQDGSSYEKAVFVKEKSETNGVHAEYAWVREHYPGSKNKGQALVFNNKKPYDILTIETADGTEKKVYFDISNFFGKF